MDFIFESVFWIGIAIGLCAGAYLHYRFVKPRLAKKVSKYRGIWR